MTKAKKEADFNQKRQLSAYKGCITKLKRTVGFYKGLCKCQENDLYDLRAERIKTDASIIDMQKQLKNYKEMFIDKNGIISTKENELCEKDQQISNQYGKIARLENTIETFLEIHKRDDL